ncbi:MAG: ABC transporter ATP-binding protein [Aphanocapsa lilacina HA4352-LM1]|jgi:iron complex transport system ATP-binding protein|nr:ABC transporter ATP-binding protein [Aphanocapsa lilacina HA4352-LM1]
MAESPQVMETLAQAPLQMTDSANVHLHVLPGEWLGLIGASGAGKSTMLRLLARLLAPFGGVVRLDGRLLQSSDIVGAAQALGLIPCGLAPTGLTVWETAALARVGSRGCRLGSEERRAVDGALERAGVGPLADRLAEPLLGAARQRLFVALALLHSPRVLLLDDPTIALDAREQLALLQLLADFKRTEHLAVVTVFDDLNLAARFCERLLLLRDGRPVAGGTPMQVLAAPLLEQVMGVEFYRLETPFGLQVFPVRVLSE